MNTEQPFVTETRNWRTIEHQNGCRSRFCDTNWSPYRERPPKLNEEPKMKTLKTRTQILETLSDRAASLAARGETEAARQTAKHAMEMSKGVPGAKAWREILEQY